MKSEMKKVAILLAAYNGERYIAEQLDSILAQTCVSVHIFISVDKSSDQTLNILNNLNSENVTILPYGNRYGNAARNFYRLIQDVDFSDYDFIGFSDQDDRWKSDKLSRGIDLIEKTDSDAYSSNVTAFWENGRSKEIIKSQPQKKWDHFFEAAGPGCTYLFRTENFTQFKEFYKKNQQEISAITHHDWLIYAWYRASGFTWLIDENSSMFYRQHGSNELGANKGIKQKFNRIKRIKNKNFRAEVLKISKLIHRQKLPTPPGIVESGGGNVAFFLKNFNQTRRKPVEAFFLAFCAVIGIY
ncbi:glycosyltransferase [Comamonas sp. CMM03]|uniref:glycosyltransferase n=1 Tax=Comamonas sp. CMM03 TaxID=2854781 RepID=UPI001C4543A7|nr:glycosyltransferase [Comamonas sp. CMM03]MBV7420829.1 glycosyltransferase [Comamonas sp. CMM03]